MKKVITILLLVLAFAFPLYASECENSVKVTGWAELKTKPDIAYITVYAQADGVLMVDAAQKANKLVEDIVTAVKKESNVIKKITVQDVALGQTKTEYWRSNQQKEIPRPQVTKRIRIQCIPNPAEIYQIIDRAIRADAVMQVSPRFQFSNDTQSIVVYGLVDSKEIVERVRKLAINDAKTKAGEISKLAGKLIGDVVGMGCSSVSSWKESMRYMGKLVDFPTEYIGSNPEEITVTYSISVSYRLK